MFGTQEQILGIVDSGLEGIANAGAELVDVEIPDLDHYLTYSTMYVARSKTDINAFLSSCEKLPHVKIQEMQKNDQYHKALDLIDAIVKGPTDMTQDLHLARRQVNQSEFQRTGAGLSARHRLGAIVYPTLLPFACAKNGTKFLAEGEAEKSHRGRCKLTGADGPA